LRIIKVMYFDKPTAEQTTTIKEALDVKVLLSANGLSLILLGVFPSSLMAYCILAFS
jgi:NADH-quinone oxidoreductase subunit N